MISAKLIPTKSIQTYAHSHKYMSNSGSPIEASLKPQVGCEMLVGRPRCRPSEVPPPIDQSTSTITRTGRWRNRPHTPRKVI